MGPKVANRVGTEFGVAGYLVHGAQIDSSTITDPRLPKSPPKSGPQKRHPNRGKTNETGAFMRIGPKCTTGKCSEPRAQKPL
jgi:hypothetical protein